MRRGFLSTLKGERSPVALSGRLSRLDALGDPRIARDLQVIALALTRAEGKLLKGRPDVRWELSVVEQRLDRAEHRITKNAA
jgi:hypothetical protein